MSQFWRHGESAEVVAECNAQQLEPLLRYDHHRVRVGDRWGILLTYHLIPLETVREPLLLKVVFNPAPDYRLSEARVRAILLAHPVAPEGCQALISQLRFRPP